MARQRKGRGLIANSYSKPSSIAGEAFLHVLYTILGADDAHLCSLYGDLLLDLCGHSQVLEWHGRHAKCRGSGRDCGISERGKEHFGGWY